MGVGRRGGLGRVRVVTTETALGLTERARSVAVGDSVVIVSGRLSGQSGRVEYVDVDPTCGCISVIVRTRTDEWIGRPSEVEVR